jgi:predicted alpha/beta hydrolase family esterase
MKTAYIFHDAFCDQFSDWYPWLKTNLEAQGYFVVVPNFPTPAGQSYSSWKAVMTNYLETFDAETLFIGHGTGGILALKLLQEMNRSINGIFLVASYAKPLGHVGYDRVNESFLSEVFVWDNIKTHARIIQIFAGQDDPFVPLAISQDLAQQLGQELRLIPDGGHLNKASGFTQIIPLAESIKESKGQLDKTIEVEAVVTEVAPEPVPTPQSSAAQMPAPLIKGSPVDEPIVATVDPLHDSGEGDLRSKSGEGTAHTMYQDMSHLINSNQGAVASSLLTKARTDAEIKKEKAPFSPKNALYIIGTLTILLLIAGIATFILNRSLPAGQKQQASAPASLILSEKHIQIDVANTESYTLSKKIRDAMAMAPSEGIADLYYINGMVRASFPSVLAKFGITVPESLSNEFLMPQAGTTPLFMHGVGTLENTPAHFLVLPVAHYDNTFIGMKEWEATLVRDLGIFIGMSDAVIKARTATDTFSDETINNRRVRILRDSENQVTLAYFFLTERIVVITDRIEAIPEILKRFANSQIYR